LIVTKSFYKLYQFEFDFLISETHKVMRIQLTMQLYHKIY